MAPRAAWRLEILGFGNVYWYKGGKADWTAAGLPFDGHLSRVPRIGDNVRRDVPTCRPDERIADVRDRVRTASWNTCFVVTADGTVLGRLHDRELDGAGDAAADVMRSGPSTFRPDVTVHQMLDYMREHELTTVPVTTSEGKLIGLALLEDLEAAHGSEVSARTSSRPRGSEP
ncbi:MAG TPA: CBS domain-containing protein [Candidatus Limnocylindria bacterium]